MSTGTARAGCPRRTFRSPRHPDGPGLEELDQQDSLAGAGVLRLRGLLGRTPPRLVLAVPRDGCLEPCAQVVVARAPGGLGPQLGGVDRVAQVVTGAVVDVLEPVD